MIRMEIYNKLLVRLHCQNEDCVLGTLEFTCPVCKKDVVNYDDWWKYRAWYENTGDDYDFEVSCPECKAVITTGTDWD